MHASFPHSIFSWRQNELHHPATTLTLLDRYHIDNIYQYVSPNDPHQKILSFLQQAKIQQKQVFFLTGEPGWALDEQAVEIIRYFKWAQQYHSLIKGIVLDIEPHTLKEFKENPKKTMGSFVKSLKGAYAFAQKMPLKMIVCLPYYLDTLGFTAELEDIIRTGTDEVAIMNYYRGKEIEHLKTEVTLSLQFGKPIHTIYELQPPGKHGLTDQNTYYNQGLQAVAKNYNEVTGAYPKAGIRLSFHEYRFYKELAEREEKDKK